MNNNQIKYSILLPTFNKCEYLYHTIKSVLNSNYHDFELLVSDDHSTDLTSEILSKFDDKRLKIIKPPIKLTQTKNYEFLLTKANGKWVTILGDDDGLQPYFFETLDKYINKYRDIELIHSKPAFYYWDNIEDIYGTRVCDYQNFFRKEKIKNSKLSLLFALVGLRQRTSLPMIYTTGVVKIDLVKKIKIRSNNFFFHSVIPDYYSMIALLFETKKYLSINEPLFWVGSSSKSAGRGVKIYNDVNKSVKKFDFINENLEVSKNISTKLHQIGISSIYFYECVLKHPYISKNWKNSLIKYLVYASSEVIFENLRKNKPETIKIKISNKEFLDEILEELEKNNLSLNLYKFFKIMIYLIFKIKKINIFLLRFVEYIFKLISNNYLILVSHDRKKFPDFNICNNYIKKKLTRPIFIK